MLRPRAFSTLLAPGSVPTSKCVVAPETPPTTLPPKVSINSLALSLPRFKPTPPPSSGKMPVITNFLPESAFAVAGTVTIGSILFRGTKCCWFPAMATLVSSSSSSSCAFLLFLLLFFFLRAAAGAGGKGALRFAPVLFFCFGTSSSKRASNRFD